MYSNADYKNINSEKIAMYGGSFNPIHKGHIQLAEYFLNELCLDELLIIPSGKPPHKSDKEIISSLHRYNMCTLAVENISKIKVSDIEVKRDGKSYTIDTLRQLKKIYEKSQLFLIMGEDMFLSLHTWKEYKEIFKTVIVCAIPRKNDNIKSIVNYSKNFEKDGLKFIISEKKVMQVSSTEIRKAVKEGLSINGKVDDKVAEYIYINSLYRGEV